MNVLFCLVLLHTTPQISREIITCSLQFAQCSSQIESLNNAKAYTTGNLFICEKEKMKNQ